MEAVNFADRLRSLCYAVNSTVHESKFVYDLTGVGGSYQLH
jgi:hypothetical protein